MWARHCSNQAEKLFLGLFMMRPWESGFRAYAVCSAGCRSGRAGRGRAVAGGIPGRTGDAGLADRIYGDAGTERADRGVFVWMQASVLKK